MDKVMIGSTNSDLVYSEEMWAILHPEEDDRD